MEPHAATVRIEALLSHRGWVRGLARRLVGEQGVDDVEQQTWLAALRSPPREGGSIHAWLATVVKNVVRKRVRTDDRRAHREAHVDAQRPARSTADVVADADAHQHVVRAVMELEEPYRTTVLLRFFEDLPPREVAVRMDTAVETVRTRTRRALERLRKALDEDYGKRTAWLQALTPLCFPADALRAPSTGATAAAVGTGVLAMATTKKLLAIGVLLAATLGGGYLAVVSSSSAGPARDADVPPTTIESTDSGGRRAARSRKPRPADESATVDTAVPDPADEPAPVDIRLVGADRRPLGRGDGVVLIFRGETVLATLETDQRGRAEFPLQTLDASVLAFVPGRPAQRVTLAAGAERLLVSFPDGEELSGIVRVDGRAPTEKVRLTLRGGEPWFDDTGLALTIRKALIDTDFGAFEISAWTGNDGRFVFRGLPAGAARLAVPEGGYIDAADDFSWDVRIPDEAVTLTLRRLPRITGRLLRPDGTPVQEGHVRVQFEGGSTGCRTGQDGAFVVSTRGFDRAASTLTVSDASGIGEREIELAHQPGKDLALGDVEIGAARQVRLLVVDLAGRPVAGAVAMLGEAGNTLGGRADGDGLLDLTLPQEAPEIRVSAIGYDVVHAVVPVNPPSPWRVELPAGTLLTVRVNAPAGLDANRFRVRLSASSGFFNGREFVYDAAYEAAGGPSSGSAMYGDGASYAWFQPDEHGVLRISGIIPHVPIRLAVFDAYGRRHGEGEARLEPAEHRTVGLAISGEPKTLRGVVRDVAGNPLKRARVRVAISGSTGRDSETANGPGEYVWTGADGAFAFTGLFAERVDVDVDRKGFARWATAELLLGDEALDVALDPGRTVTFAITPPDGVSRDAVEIFIELPGVSRTSEGAERDDDGILTATHLPRGTLKGVVEWDDQEHAFVIPESDDHIVLDLRRSE